MKKAIAIVLAIMSMSALCAPVRSMLGAKGAINKPDSSGGWKNPYITDGLIAMWDGEWNAGPGQHDPNAKVWKDLIGNRDLTLGEFASVGTNYVANLNGSGYVASTKSKLFSSYTDIGSYEVVFMVNGPLQSYSLCFFGFDGKSSIDYCFRGILYHRGHNKWAFANSYSNVGIANARAYLNKWISLHVNYEAKYPIHPIYINNVQKNDAGFVDNLRFTGIQIGYAANQDGANYFRCIRLYNRSLTTEEVQTNYLVDKERFNLP